MSTRCQIGFYKSATQPLNKPEALIYRHPDGYPGKPDGEKDTADWGVLSDLVPFCREFQVHRGMDDIPYLACRTLERLMLEHGTRDQYLSYGISNPNDGLHGDEAYYYAVSPGLVRVWKTGWDQDLAKLGKPLKSIVIA